MQVFPIHIKYKLNKNKKNTKHLIHQNNPFGPSLLLHIFSAFFPPKIGGRLKKVLPSFTVSGESQLMVV